MQQRSIKEGGPSPNAETTLWQQAQADCRQSINLLMSRHDGLVLAVVRQQYLGTYPFHDDHHDNGGQEMLTVKKWEQIRRLPRTGKDHSGDRSGDWACAAGSEADGGIRFAVSTSSYE